jgi:dCMP deaminase
MASYHEPLDAGYLFQLAAVAALNSEDPSTQNGAVIVSGNAVAYGCNRFARGLRRKPDRYADRDTKLRMTVHAERAAIQAAVDAGLRTEGATMYCLWAACTVCARDIIEAGIDRLVTLESYYSRSPERWRSDIDAATEMLREAGVGVQLLFDTELPAGWPKLRFNGELIT